MNELISRRLKHAREKRGLTQAQLSEKLGFKDRQTLAAIEAGQRKILAEELVRAAQALGVDLDYFMDSFRLDGEGRFSWRAKDVSPNLLEEFEDRAGRWIATYRRLGESKGAKTTLLQPTLTLNERSTFENAIGAAEALGQEWELGDVPALKLEEAIRKHLGALVLHVDVNMRSGVSGAACQVPGLSVILINRNEGEGRRHFDLAHECFHLLTWEQMPPEHSEPIEESYRGKGKHKRVEQLANNFAAALLIPRRVLERLWHARDEQNINEWLNKTASKFLVTAKALRWRVNNLKWLSKADEAAIQEDRLIANGRPLKEQRTKPELFSREFVQRLHAALSEGDLSVRRAASLLEMTIEDLADLFKDYKLRVPFDL